MAKLGNLVVPLTATDDYSKQFNKMVRSANKMGKAIDNIGRKMTIGITMPLLGAGAASLKFGVDMNKAMANVGTMIPGQREKLQGYKKDIMDLAVTSGTAGTTLADGMYSVISALGDSADSMGALKIATKAAKAGVSDVQTSVELLAGTANAYGDTSDEMLKKISDMAFMAVKLGVTTFPELAAAMGNTLATARDAGVGMKELYADTATLTKVMHGAGNASTALDSVIGELLKGGGKLDDVFKKLHVKSGPELIKKFGGLQGALLAMKDSVGGDTVAFRNMFGRKEAMKGASLLTGALKELAKENLKIIDTAGATEEALKEQTQGINKAGFMAEQAREKFKNLGIKLSDKLLPVILKIADKLSPLIDKIANASDSALALGLKIAGAAAAAGPLLWVFGKAVTTVGTLATMLGGGGLAGVLTALTGPIGLTVLGIAGLTAGIVYFWDELQPIAEAIKGPVMGMFEDLKNIFADNTNNAGGLGNSFKDLLRSVSPILAPLWKVATYLALMPFRHVINMVKFSTVVWTGLNKIFKIVSGALRAVYYWTGNLLKKWIATTTAGKAFGKVIDVISNVLSVVSDMFSKAWDAASKFFGGIGEWLDKIGIEIDKTADRQEGKFKGIDINSTVDDIDINKSIVADMNNNTQNNISVSFDNMPEWMQPQVSSGGAGGGNVTVKKGKGQIMQGAL